MPVSLRAYALLQPFSESFEKSKIPISLASAFYSLAGCVTVTDIMLAETTVKIPFGCPGDDVYDVTCGKFEIILWRVHITAV